MFGLSIFQRSHAARMWAGLVLPICLAGAAARVSASEICVANDDQLILAAVNATLTPMTIKLVQGTYHVDNTPFNPTGSSFPTFQGFSLLGGYTANCASRQIAPGNTILHTGANAFFYADVIGDVTIEGIGFTGPQAGVGLHWDDYFHNLPPAVHLTLRRNTFTGSQSSPINIDWQTTDESLTFTARLVDNLVHDNPGNGSGGSCAVELGAVEGTDATYTLINNTIVDNAVGDGGVCIGRYGDNEGSLFAYNNILYGNGGYDLASNITAMVLVDNVIGTHDAFPPPIVPPVGTQTGNPELDANDRPIESPPSPVINSGADTVPGGLPSHDLDGGPRVTGSTVDRGAFESSIDDEFLQTVVNTDNTGAGSLRAAIQSVNANGSGLISFDLGSGCGPHIITLSSELPALTGGAIINGYSQAGASANDLDVGDDATLCVILESGGSSVTHGIQVSSAAGDATAVSIKGLAFSGFSDAAIDLQGGSGHFVAGDHFGGNVGGHSLQPNGIDIRLGIATHDATIGSDDVADRNIIGDATGSGIVLQGGGSPPLVIGTYNNQILDNYIGVGWSQTGGNYTDRGNGTRGIHLLGHDNTVSGNLIGDNVQAGMLVDGPAAGNNLIDGNFIGADANGSPLGNGNAGIHVVDDSDYGPNGNTIRYNTIANNGDEGVWIENGQQNKIRRNAIYGNGGLGIDLAAEGVTANDDDGGIQQLDYANRGRNFPVLTSAAGGYASGRISGALTTTQGDYTIDVYVSPNCDASGNGEGNAWLKGATVTVDVPQGLDQGTATFALSFHTPPPFPLVSGSAITATTTDSAGDTSEFSACVPYVNDTIFADGFDPPPQ